MTNAQKIALRTSTVRQRLSDIAGLEGDTFTDEIRAEAGELETEYADLETRHRAALIAEGDEEAEKRGAFGNGDGEPAERRRLLEAVSVQDYLATAKAGGEIRGAAADLAEALELPTAGPRGGVALPWEVLGTAAPAMEQRAEAGAVEERVATGTGAYAGGVAQRPILQRLFGPGIMDALGVRIDTVPEGRTEWPLISDGVEPEQKAEAGAATPAAAATFATEALRPKRLTGVYEFTYEAAAQVPDLEQALRRDLADSVMSKMSDRIMSGSETANAHDVDGFLTKIAAVAPVPTAVATYADYAGAHAQAVDGLHASMETEVSSVVGVASYRHAAGVFQAGSGEAGTEALRRRSAGCMASVYVPAAAGDMQNGNVFHAGGPNGGAMRGDSIAAVWPTLEVVRDIYSKADEGTVALTWITLWDAETAFRAAAYKRLSFLLA